MTWEFIVATSNKQQQQQQASTTRNQSKVSSIAKTPAVLVSHSKSPHWVYEDKDGNILQPSVMEGLTLDLASLASAQLRQGLPISRPTPPVPRPIGMVLEDFEKAKDKKFGNFSGLPAMPMLTCFYSVNDPHAMSGWNLMERMERIRHIPCIATQGGRDPICPPDAALDVQQVWPEMELRIPLNAGHSMCHLKLTHELVQATDRMAKKLG